MPSKPIAVDERVPFARALPLSLQHLCAMFGATMLVPFLFRVRDVMRHLKVHLDVFLVTSEPSPEETPATVAVRQRNGLAQVRWPGRCLPPSCRPAPPE